MNKFVRSLLAELIPVWMTPQEPRRDEPPTARSGAKSWEQAGGGTNSGARSHSTH